MSLLMQMTEAFYSVSYGNEEPDTIRCSTATAKRIYAAIRENESTRNIVHIVAPDTKWTDESFLGAKFLLDDRLPDGLVRIENSARTKKTAGWEPYWDRFSCALRLPEGS